MPADGGAVNHKRGRPKNARAGCLLCKPWKMNGAKRGDGWCRIGEARARIAEREQIAPQDVDDYDLSYDDGWCDEPDCPVCASVEIRTPRLTCPLVARAA